MKETVEDEVEGLEVTYYSSPLQLFLQLIFHHICHDNHRGDGNDDDRYDDRRKDEFPPYSDPEYFLYLCSYRL